MAAKRRILSTHQAYIYDTAPEIMSSNVHFYRVRWRSAWEASTGGLYQAYELRVRPQICDLLADGKKNFLRPGPAKSKSRRLAASELADTKIWDTLILYNPLSELVRVLDRGLL